MDEENRLPESVPYIVYEAEMDREERKHEAEMERQDKRHKRTVVALIISIIMIFVSNALWLYSWMQYDYTSDTSTIHQDGTGHNTSIIGDGNGS